MGWAARAKGGGTIAVLSSEVPRSAAFIQSLLALEKPAGTRIEWITGGPNIAHNRNLAVQATQGEWLWMLDDDMLVRPDTLTRLLAHFARPEVSIVVPFCVKRTPPYSPVLARDGANGLEPYTPEGDGLQPVAAAGTAGMLIRAQVLQAMPHPWFTVGRWHPVRLDEDFVFCRDAAERGFQTWVDLDTPMGHLAPFALWPAKGPDGWGVSYHAVTGASVAQIAALTQKATAEAYGGGYTPELRPPFTCS